MIVLDKSLLINQGTVRACYHHPHNSTLVVKVPTGSKSDRDQANSIELMGYQDLMQKHEALTCISHCHGFEPTNMGDGLICDCISDANGSVSKSILDLINSENPPEFSYLKSLVQKFTQYLLDEKIYIFDLNVKNIVMQQQSDASYKAIIIDLKGHCELKEFIPLSRYIPYFRRKKLERRCRQLLERTEMYWEKRTIVKEE
jgi:hypothetical protein